MVKRVMWIVFVMVAVGACDKKEDLAPGTTAGGSAGPSAPATGTAAGGSAGPSAPATTAPATTEPAVAAAGFKVGDFVIGQWTDGRWYPGKIGAVNADGTYRVNYNDGDVSKSLPLAKVRPRKAPTSGGGGAAATTTSCAGGGTRCGGRCVDLLNDPKNCHRCGFVCPEACMRGSCVSNAYKHGP